MVYDRRRRLTAHAVLCDIFDLGCKLGTGAFADVVSARRLCDGRAFAIKFIERSKCACNPKALKNEIDILKVISHPNIVGLEALYEDDEHVYLVMELVTGGELFDRIIERGSFTECDAARFSRQLLEALSYLHDNNITHRDLKPENLLFQSVDDNSPLKLCDFGLARLQVEGLMTRCGSPGYVAPEILNDLPYTSAVDMWSIGVIVYVVLCGYMPFYAETDPELFRLITEASYEFESPTWDNISVDAKDFVASLLIINPKERITAKQALQHPWILSGGGTPSGKDVPSHKNLKELVRRKWRQAINLVKATERFRHIPEGKVSVDADMQMSDVL